VLHGKLLLSRPTHPLTNSRKYHGHTTAELPFRAAFGIYGSYLCLLISILALMAQFYVALYPVGGPNLDAKTFFNLYLAGPLTLFLYICWKVYSWIYVPADRPLFIRTKDIDIYSGMRAEQAVISGQNADPDQRRASIQELQESRKKKGAFDYVKAGVRQII
jgi:yeast amino acid transporter